MDAPKKNSDRPLLEPPRGVKLPSRVERPEERNQGMASTNESAREPRAPSDPRAEAAATAKPTAKGTPAGQPTSAPKTTSANKPVSAKGTAEASGSDVKRMIGPFLLETRLGVGGMGVVYKAT